MQSTIVTESIIAQWRNQYGIDSVFPDDISQFLAKGIYFLAHEIAIGKAILVSNEAKEPKLLRFLRGNVLCQSYASLFHAVDESPFGFLVVESGVVNALDHNAERPQ